MTFKIIDEINATCQIGTGNGAAISTSTQGKIVLPKIANGYAVTAIAANAFANTKIGAVAIPNTIGSIGEKAFYGCSSLDDVKSYIEHPFDIPANAFSGLASYASLTVLYGTRDEYLNRNGWNGFSSVWQDMAVVDGIRYSVNGAVPEDKGEPYTAWVQSSQWNDYKGNVTIPETFTIGDEAFVVVGIDDGAFEKSNIRSVTIPKTVKYIDSYAFANCKNLEEIYSAITEVNDTGVSATAFEGSAAQAVLYVPIGTKELYEAADVWKQFTTIIETDMAVNIDGFYYAFISSEVFEEEYRGEGYFPLTRNTYIAIVMATPTGMVPYSGDIIIPSSVSYGGNTYNVEAIMKDAFIGTGITSITLPTTLRVIGADAFAECRNLKEVVIPEGVVEICEEAFVESYNIKRIELPSTLSKIWDEAFADCTGLKEVVSHMENPFGIRDDVFRLNDAHNERITLYVPKGCKPKYEVTDGWKLFKNIVEMDHEDSEGIVTVEKLSAAEKYYDLQGRTVLRPNRGIYVKEGKIVVVK